MKKYEISTGNQTTIVYAGRKMKKYEISTGNQWVCYCYKLRMGNVGLVQATESSGTELMPFGDHPIPRGLRWKVYRYVSSDGSQKGVVSFWYGTIRTTH